MIKFGAGNLLVFAGPGSGKTFCLTHRINYLINVHSVPPENILVITFTRAAALEMKERFNSIAKEFLPVTFATFHSCFYNILLKSGQNKLSICSNIDKINILKSVLKDFNLLYEDNLFISGLIKEFSIFSNNPNRNFESHTIDNIKFKLIYEAYKKTLIREKFIDFDDIITLCYDLLSKNKDILVKWQDKFKYILVDEFQDINPLQYEILKLLGSKYGNVFAVGDDDQAIYSFRGSSPLFMKAFPKDFSNTKEMFLDRNYRSGSWLVKSNSHFISKNKERKDKNLLAYSKEEGNIFKKIFESKKAEFEFIKEEIQSFHNKETTCILLRTNYCHPYLKECLQKSNIEFYIKEDFFLIDSFISKDILAYVKLSKGELTRENMFRVMNKPNRYIPRNMFNDNIFTFNDLYRKAAGKEYLKSNIKCLEFYLNTLSKMTLFEAVCYIRKIMGYDEYLICKAFSSGVKKDVYFDVINVLTDMSKEYDDVYSFENVLMNEKSERGKNSNPDAKVKIMTMHSSKGLEFDNVFIPDVNEGNIPHFKEFSKELMEEERRLMYVAMTRAKSRLFVLSVKSKNETNINPSVFYKEI